MFFQIQKEHEADAEEGKAVRLLDPLAYTVLSWCVNFMLWNYLGIECKQGVKDQFLSSRSLHSIGTAARKLSCGTECDQQSARPSVPFTLHGDQGSELLLSPLHE